MPRPRVPFSYASRRLEGHLEAPFRTQLQSTPTLNMHVDESQCGYAKSAVVAFNMLRKAGFNPPSWNVQVRLLAWRRMRHFDAMQARRERGLNRADAAPSVQLKENVDS